MTQHREQWSSEPAFILAALGSAVGLGNIWRFPYIVGENGGAAFVLVYLCCVLLLGLPALIATIMVGRRGQSSPIRCFEVVARAEGLSHHWVLLGWLLVLSAYFLLSFFSVVASWTFDYLFTAFIQGFSGLTPARSLALFAELKDSPLRMALWHGVFMGLTLLIVGRGIRKGIEQAIKLMMPLLFLLLIILLCYSLIAGDTAAAVAFLFTPDFDRLTTGSILLAVGQAFLSLSVGGAGMLVYGAYLNKQASIPRSSVIIAGADTCVALATGLVIFPVVFAYGLQPSAGPGLIFVTLPIAFAQMPGGVLFGALFFLLLLLAALTSAFSMFEPVVAWINERYAISRPVAAWIAGGLAWFIGLATVLSFNVWSAVRPLAVIPRFAGLNIFRSLEYTVTSLMLPVGTFMVALFVGWRLSGGTIREEYGAAPEWRFRVWRLLIRYVVPLFVAGIFVATI